MQTLQDWERDLPDSPPKLNKWTQLSPFELRTLRREANIHRYSCQQVIIIQAHIRVEFVGWFCHGNSSEFKPHWNHRKKNYQYFCVCIQSDAIQMNEWLIIVNLIVNLVFCTCVSHSVTLYRKLNNLVFSRLYFLAIALSINSPWKLFLEKWVWRLWVNNFLRTGIILNRTCFII